MTGIDIKVAFFIAYKTISKGHKSTLALIVFILSLSFFNLMFVSGFLSGFSDGIIRSMVETTTAHLVVTPQEEPIKKEYIIDQASVRAGIETIPGIEATTAHYQLGGSFAYDKEQDGVFTYVSAPIIAINQSEEKAVLSVADNIVSGEFPDTLQKDEIILGANLAGGFGTEQSTDLGGVMVGDTVLVVYGNGVSRTYTVRGIFKVTIGSIGGTAYISTKEAEAILSTFNNASEIMVKADLTKYTLDEYVTRIKSLYPELVVETYTTRLATVGILVAAFNIIALIVSVISIIVAAITIFVMIYVNAVSKRRQIGILKAIGIKESIIELSYVIQSIFYATLAVMFGMVIVFFMVVPFLDARPIMMPFGEATLVFTTTGIVINIVSLLVSGLLAGFVPAKMVARENILTSIWG
jgi:putative ABC transport system permease protein